MRAAHSAGLDAVHTKMADADLVLSEALAAGEKEPAIRRMRRFAMERVLRGSCAADLFGANGEALVPYIDHIASTRIRDEARASTDLDLSGIMSDPVQALSHARHAEDRALRREREHYTAAADAVALHLRSFVWRGGTTIQGALAYLDVNVYRGEIGR